MTGSTDITPALVDALYHESMELAEEARAHFSDNGPRDLAETVLSPAHQVELSCESLKVTTRLMHAIAWLLNRKAFFSGELTERQLRANGHLLGEVGESDPVIVARLDPQSRYLVSASQDLFARIARMEQRFRTQGQMTGQAMGDSATTSPALEIQQRLRASLQG
ncbi:MAG: DUF1465 family protein [Pseudomonadota bacterium]